ncbi:prolyl-tRNA synthetase associated domain-containing protein [Lysinibacillus sp. CNPSo 3705]|uniref:prolyl-tRNA synthetase associated domain-containing protein n=1 Tax=Lysinibacillus sp. CNPSo 3705 TaxID=3028148 RepID=UPI0023641638|nr:prolyl-tRNA synthetase associated domain-containing protein [Lysinibacillus sp. CNPSo 3705]MDD1505558.1 prolyl-tRNA synthetase associated domain-containing protein [Lysinibacillus sp. CNPSo 3705]
MSQNQQLVYNILDEKGISYKISNHAAVHTINDMNNLQIEGISQIVKNLFLRDDKKKRYFLVTVEKDRRINLKDLQNQLQSRPLSFASENDLQKYLGLKKGSVTPFGIFHDTSNIVEVIFDKKLAKFQTIGIHPNENTATVWIQLKDLVSVIQDYSNKISYIELGD